MILILVQSLQVVMHVFDALLRSDFRPERTIEFHCKIFKITLVFKTRSSQLSNFVFVAGYAGEERGLLGSRNLANLYRAERREVYAMLQIDMVTVLFRKLRLIGLSGGRPRPL